MRESPLCPVNPSTTSEEIVNRKGLVRISVFEESSSIILIHGPFFGSLVLNFLRYDIPLSIKATQLASKVDTIIIMSGDSDFVELVHHLKAEGVRVEIAAVKVTTAQVLVDDADHFHEITNEDWFVYNAPKK